MSRGLAQGVKPDLVVYKVFCVCLLVFQALILALVTEFNDCGQMCLISLVQLVLFVVVALASPCRQPFCVLFLVVNWIFNCGQIACIAVGYDDVLNLDYRWYGSQTTIDAAFRFYLYAQTFIAAGAFLFQKLPDDKPVRVKSGLNVNDKASAKCLIAAGAPFWLYVNGSKLAGAAADAYRGVYSLVIPAPVQAAAFFFEAGLLLMLLIAGREHKGTVLFWTGVAINVVLMTTGSRQYSVCFLVVWCLIYFAYLKKLSVSRAVGMVLAAVALLFAVDAFGELRTMGFSLDALSTYLADASLFEVVWDSLGEFGSAFSTLVTSVSHVPTELPYGMGATYAAGLLSVIPTLVSHFPVLEAATQFTTSISGSAFLGGSMLGEFFYNFGWYGVVLSFLVGVAVAWCQNRFNEIGKKEHVLIVWASAVLAMFLLLFIRGYFTDAIMKTVYVFCATWIATGFIRRFSERKRNGADAVRVGEVG